MSGRKARVARKEARVAAEQPRRAGFWRSPRGLAAAGVVVLVVAASFVTPRLFSSSPPTAGRAAPGVRPGFGLPAGSAVPSFAGRDVLSGRAITSKSVFPRRTLLFFSEGVMCQACFEQIQGLQQFGADLKRRGIQLVSITPDSPDSLRQSIAQYGITTPVISDESRTMSMAFNTLGEGMHADTPGHAFALIERGRVLWYRDYWLAPYRTMYVPPRQLLRDIPTS